MEFKFELQEWINGCRAYDCQDYDTALRVFMKIGDNARMHFNIGLIFSVMQDHRRALAAFKKALSMDPFLAVACFQKGVSHFSMGDILEAYQEFDAAYQKLRGNAIINYHQLGLAFRLYECEVRFNRGICQLYLGRIDAGLTDLYYAQKTKMTEEHDIIDQAVRDRGKGYSVYSIPPGIIYRPLDAKLQQLRGLNTVINPSSDRSFDHASSIGRKNSVLVPYFGRRPPQLRPSLSASTSSSSLLSDGFDGSKQQPQQQRWLSPSTSTSQPPVQVIVQPSYSTEARTGTPTFVPTINKRQEEHNEWRFVDRRQTIQQPQQQQHHQLNPQAPHQPVNPFPIPIAQHNEEEAPGSIIDTMSSYGDVLDDELEEVYASLESYLARPINEPSASNAATATKGPMIAADAESNAARADTKLKIKAHYTDTRILLVAGDISFDELLDKLRAKFDTTHELQLQYKDEENELVLMIDQEDLAMARHIARQRGGKASNGNMEKLEIWCVS
ncbi:hypothetical protein BX666DRAFT_1964022 [Dichotomocladium elegans]|nr:hypothetical protein BX666DRAFT_1964022 [Dichotomocladium elegans]